MKLAICAVRDIKGDAYANPMFVPTTGIAIRSFIDAVNTEDPNSNLWKHPGDFELWHLGYYDDSNGTFENIQHQSLGTGDTVKVRNRAAGDAELQQLRR